MYKQNINSGYTVCMYVCMYICICVSWSGVELFTLASFSGLGPCTERKVVDIVPLLETARRSLYEVLYFAVLLDRCLMYIYSTSQYFQFVNAQNKMFSQLQKRCQQYPCRF